MKLIDLKVDTQLRLGFFMIFFLIVVLGVISWSQGNQLANQTTELYEHPFTVRTTLGELKADVLYIQHGMEAIIQSRNDAEMSKVIQTIDVHKAHFFKQLDIIDKHYLGSKADVDNVYKTFIEWNAICDESILLIRGGKMKEVIDRNRFDGVGGSHVDMLLGKIKTIDDFARNKAEDFYYKSVDLNKDLKMQLLFWDLGIILIVLVLIITLMRSIKRPLSELNTVTQFFKQGKRDVRSKYVSHNEFGLLSDSFNELADTIEAAMDLNEKAAKLNKIMLSEEDPRRFCRSLLSALLEYTWSQMGAVYLLNDEKTKFEIFECIGINVANCKSFSATQFDGEFGSVLATKKMQHITNIPENTRFTFAAVIGEFMPKEIITIPILDCDEVVGIISLAKIKTYSVNSLKLLNTILGTLSARMGGILTYRKVVAFSQKLEYQNIELETQRSELEAQKNELSSQTNELLEQNIELEIQKNQLDESNKLKTSFLSNMSHELRTPLNSVIALSGVLNRRLAGKVPDEEYSYLDVIERNGRNLLLLINDILDLSRIEAGREELDIRYFNVNDLINDVVEMIEPQAKEKNIILRIVENDNNLPINSDYEKYRHILQNLIGNAVKFTDNGFVEVTAVAKGDTIKISVCDSGIGIQQEKLSHIFEEFRQADGSNSRKYGGTGLGLTIARKYAEMLGGRIEVESTFGEGSCFTLFLPLHFEGQLSSVVSAETVYYTKSNNPKNLTLKVNAKDKTILLVEDTEAIVIQMKDILETQGYNMMVARNGSEALEQISQNVPDGMILDLMMPGVDGFEVLKSIREKERTDHLPVIILTAKYVTKEELSFLKHNNIHQLIHKGDINKEQLLGTVASMVYKESDEKILPMEEKLLPIVISGVPIVLVIEDNPDNMVTIKALLSDKCTIIEAEDGRTGIEMAHRHQPHLILMDIALPGINGTETLRELRKDIKLKFIPVIAVSASAMKGDKEDFIAQGFNDYISKPIDNKIFTKVLYEWIGK